MAPVELPFLQVYRARGHVYAYYRRAGQRIRLKGAPGSPEFLAAYDSARRKVEATQQAAADQPGAAPRGSLQALAESFRAAPEYRQLSRGTQAGYDRHIDALLPEWGDLLVADLPRTWVMAMRDKLQETPRAANYRVTVIKRLLSFAVDREWRADNPASRVQALRTGAGHRRWTTTEIAAMSAPAAGEIALPVILGLATAQRLADVLRLTWSAYDGSAITVRQAKQAHLSDAQPLVLPLDRALRERLDAERLRQRQEAEAAHKPIPATICVTDSLRPWRPDWFKHRFAAARAELGLPTDLHFHGLRHTRASQLAEEGASDAEIQAVTGHRTRSQVERYTKQARQKTLAKAAFAHLRPGRKKNGSV